VTLRNELRITISSRTEQGYPLLISGPVVFGEPTGILQIDLNSTDLQERLSRTRKERAGSQSFKDLGVFLFNQVFKDQLATTLELSWKRTETESESANLRIELHILADELHLLPWETMYHPVRELWLSTSRDSPMARYVDAVVPNPLKVSLPLKILACVAEPHDLPPVGSSTEVTAILDTLQNLRKERIVEVSVVRNCQRDSLCTAMEQFKPHIFHFIGHGKQIGTVSGLVMERADGSGEFITADMLQELLQSTHTVRGAVLSACESYGAAIALARQGIAAIGMQDSIRSEASIHFCRSLYEALASGQPFDVSANCARFTVRLECGIDRKDWWLPVTFLAGGTADLFKIEKPVTTIQVVSDPVGAHIFMDNIHTGQKTPDTVIIQDDTKHLVTVVKSGYEKPVPQEVGGTGFDQPARLEFMLQRKKGYLLIRTHQENIEIRLIKSGQQERKLLGTTNRDGVLGPVPVPVGNYQVEAVFWSRSTHKSGGSRITKDTIVQPGTTVQVELNPPEPKSAVKKLVGSLFQGTDTEILKAIKLVLYTLAVLVLASGLVIGIRSLKRNSSKFVAKKPGMGGMVEIEGGRLYKGHWDESISVYVLDTYKDSPGLDPFQLLTFPPRQVNVPSFYIDTYEVTNAEYRKFLQYIQKTGDHSKCHPDELENKDHTPELWKKSVFGHDDEPVVGIDWYDAYAYAAWAGKRLPTNDEWELAARGNEGWPYPWGNRYLDRFYSTQGPQKVHDLPRPRQSGPVGMAGNVTEWTASSLGTEEMKVTRGGTWGLIPGDLYALTFFPSGIMSDRTKAINLGFRCAKDADKKVINGMVRIKGGGKIMLGGENTPLLHVMRKNISNALMFLKDGSSTVEVRPFRIDKYEVTNAQYRVFLEDIKKTGNHSMCHPDEGQLKDHTPLYWNDPKYNQNDQPVVGVDWYDAYAYAKWAGKRLPTGDEWEFAAKGKTKRLYPWGDRFDPTYCVCIESRAKGPVDVNSYEKAISPIGALHMAGNVMEWTIEDAGPSAPKAKVVRGGSWEQSCEILGLTYFRQYIADSDARSDNIGFRCVADMDSTE
jgi:formylglycine-generating enzyme required for sulfatase activity